MRIFPGMNHVDRGIPDDLHEELEDAGLLQAFENLPYSERNKHVEWIATARDDAERRQRLQKVISNVRREAQYNNNRVKSAYGQTRTTG